MSHLSASRSALRPLHPKYGTWALVTGASEGIGREFALALAQLGQNLVLVARRQPILEELAQELRQAHDIQVKVSAADLTDAQQTRQVMSDCEGLDLGLLIACAGFGGLGEFIQQDAAHLQAMFDVNCRAVLSLTHHYAQKFAQERRGGIVLMSSLVAFQGVPLQSHYAATKAYIQTLAEGLKLELAPYGVDVIASAPGPVLSGFAERANMKMGFGASAASVAQGTLQALGRRGTVRPGWLSKGIEASLALLPRGGRARIMGMIMRGMMP